MRCKERVVLYDPRDYLRDLVIGWVEVDRGRGEGSWGIGSG